MRDTFNNNYEEFSNDDYRKLVQFLKSDFLIEILPTIDGSMEHNRLIEYVEALFKIEVEKTQRIKNIRIKQYHISNQSRDWRIIIGTGALLFAYNTRPYRERLLVNEHIQGVFTLDDAFFEVSAFQGAVIVLGDKPAEKIWLTSASTIDDVIEILSDIHTYDKNVYFTERLDSISFLPENYNGNKEKIDKELDKYETKTLREVAEIILGKGARRYEYGEIGIPYIRQGDIQKGVIKKTNVCIIDTAAEKYAKQLLQEGDILLTKNYGQHKIAKVTFDDLPAIASNNLFIIRAFGVPDDYLYQYLTSETGKSILDKQLASIEHGATVLTINKSDLEKLRVPIFDEATMLKLTKVEEMKAADVIPMLDLTNRLMTHTKHNLGRRLEVEVYNAFINAGWPENEVRLYDPHCILELNGTAYVPDVLLLDGDNRIGAVEVKTDLSHIPPDWLSRMSKVLKGGEIPCLILTTGYYYEVHFTHLQIVKKLKKVPSKAYLLSIIDGKGGN